MLFKVIFGFVVVWVVWESKDWSKGICGVILLESIVIKGVVRDKGKKGELI